MKNVDINIVFAFLLFFTILIFELQIIGINNNISKLEIKQKNITNISVEDKFIDFIIEKYSQEYNIDKNLIKAISIVESGSKHYKNGSQDVKTSIGGAIGIMQLMPQTAKSMGVNPYSLDENIKGAVKYLSYLDKKFNGDLDKIICAYNIGESHVIKYGIPYGSMRYVNIVKKEKAKLDDKNIRAIRNSN